MSSEFECNNCLKQLETFWSFCPECGKNTVIRKEDNKMKTIEEWIDFLKQLSTDGIRKLLEVTYKVTVKQEWERKDLIKQVLIEEFPYKQVEEYYANVS